MVTLSATRIERVRVLRGITVVSVQRWTVDSDAAMGVERAIPRRKREVLAGIRIDRVALSVPTSILCSKRELAAKVC